MLRVSQGAQGRPRPAPQGARPNFPVRRQHRVRRRAAPVNPCASHKHLFTAEELVPGDLAASCESCGGRLSWRRFRLGRMVVLTTLVGGVRALVLGDVFCRLVAHSLARGLGPKPSSRKSRPPPTAIFRLTIFSIDRVGRFSV